MTSTRPVITIREAVADDVPLLHAAILAIAEHVGEAGQVTSTQADLRRFGFGEKAAFEAAIAEADGRFAGMCLFFPAFSTWLGRPGVYVQDLYVEDSFRGLGIGERLLRHVARLSAGKGGAYMRLSVDEKNHGAQAFYSRLGLAWSREDRSFIARGQAFISLSEGGSQHQRPEE